MSGSDRLAPIVQDVRRRLAHRQQQIPEAVLQRETEQILNRDPRRSLYRAIAGGRHARVPRIIAEVKRASPAAGDLGSLVDAGSQAHLYRQGGASAISVVTEPDHFNGDIRDLAAVRPVGLPVLRKDFIFDRYQLLESVVAGADVVLLIARILDTERLGELLQQAETLGLECLVEINDEQEAAMAIRAGATLIGINNRDLRSFTIDRNRTRRLAPLVADHAVVVSASGMMSVDDVLDAHAAGVDACLIGEALMRADDPVTWLRSITGAVGVPQAGETP